MLRPEGKHRHSHAGAPRATLFLPPRRGSAAILAEMRIDNSSISPALCTDTPRTPTATRARSPVFGENVAQHGRWRDQAEPPGSPVGGTKEAENLRKLVLAMSSDIRVLWVEARRPPNKMRTLHHIRTRRGGRRIERRDHGSLFARLASRIGWRRSSASSMEMAFASSIPTARLGAGAPGHLTRKRRCGWCRDRGELIRRWEGRRPGGEV